MWHAFEDQTCRQINEGQRLTWNLWGLQRRGVCRQCVCPGEGVSCPAAARFSAWRGLPRYVACLAERLSGKRCRGTEVACLACRCSAWCLPLPASVACLPAGVCCWEVCSGAGEVCCSRSRRPPRFWWGRQAGAWWQYQIESPAGILHAGEEACWLKLPLPPPSAIVAARHHAIHPFTGKPSVQCVSCFSLFARRPRPRR